MMLFGQQFRSRKGQGHGKQKRRMRKRGSGGRAGLSQELTLADVPPDCQAKVIGFLPGLPRERRAHLQAYGLVPGYWVRVIQQSPVTVVQVEHTELALERELARGVQVAEIEQKQGIGDKGYGDRG